MKSFAGARGMVKKEEIQASGAVSLGDVMRRIRRALPARRWGFSLSSTHQSSQFSDVENTVAELASADKGRIPGFRVWNAQLSWKLPLATPVDLLLGMNNLTDKRYYTRNVDNNAGRMVGAPRMVYVQGRVAF